MSEFFFNAAIVRQSSRCNYRLGAVWGSKSFMIKGRAICDSFPAFSLHSFFIGISNFRRTGRWVEKDRMAYGHLPELSQG